MSILKFPGNKSKRSKTTLKKGHALPDAWEREHKNMKRPIGKPITPKGK